MFMFGSSTVTANNLGGQGPVTTDPMYIEYSALLDLVPADVVLRVTNNSEYMPSFNPGGGVLFNGLSGEFGNINVLSDTEVDLTFQFLNSTSGEPYVLPAFFFTWFDFDMNMNGGRVETLKVQNTFSFSMLSPMTTVAESMGPPGFTTFESTVPGTTADNPTAPANLTQEQEDKAVLFLYEDTSSFNVTLCISGPANGFGRNLIFGGISSVLDSPPPPSPPPIGGMPGTGDMPPPPGAVVISDPHFQGLDGEYFDFDGVPGSVYALIVNAEDEMALIARFQTAYTTGVSYKNGALLPYKPKGTWVSSASFSISAPTAEGKDTVTLIVSSDRASLPKKLESGSMQVVASSESAYDLMKVDVSKKGPATVVSFESEHLDGKMYVVPPPSSWGAEDATSTLSHMNIAIDHLRTSDTDLLDGIIGVSARGLKPFEARPEEKSFEAINFVDEALVAQLP